MFPIQRSLFSGMRNSNFLLEVSGTFRTFELTSILLIFFFFFLFTTRTLKIIECSHLKNMYDYFIYINTTDVDIGIEIFP